MLLVFRFMVVPGALHGFAARTSDRSILLLGLPVCLTWLAVLPQDCFLNREEPLKTKLEQDKLDIDGQDKVRA